MKLVGEALDEVIKKEMREKSQIRFLCLKLRLNPQVLTIEEASDIENTVSEFRQLAEDYRLKTVFSSIYLYGEKETAERVLDLWYEDVMALGSPEMKRVARSIYSRREGILAWFEMHQQRYRGGYERPNTDHEEDLQGF